MTCVQAVNKLNPHAIVSLMQGVLAPIELAQMSDNLDLVEVLIEKYGCRMDPSVIKVHIEPYM